jgi:hypothetical protein
MKYFYLIYKELRLHIKSRLPVSIEKPFSKTHAPEFGIRELEKF